jgi:hypothetical protein
MSGFGRSEASSAWTDPEGEEFDGFPEDFSQEEASFASEMRGLFSPECEQLPPLYVQTLLEDVRHAPAEPGYEQKLTYRVFRRLNLARVLLPEGVRQAWQPRTLWANLRESALQLSRPAASALGGALLVMLLTVFLTGSSFAAGLQILIGHTGVVQVQRYPANVRASRTHAGAKTHASAAASPPLTVDPGMPLAWLGRSAGDYAYVGVQLQDPQSWSQGPIVELQYQRTHAAQGTGVLDIREFRVNPQYAAVLQVVQAGYAWQTTADGTAAVYVDGTWTQRTANPMKTEVSLPFYAWVPGQHSELILERDGVVFWIVGDQRDGLDESGLVQMAAQLQDVDLNTLQPRARAIRIVGESLLQSFQQPEGLELLQLEPADSGRDTRPPLFVANQP